MPPSGFSWKRAWALLPWPTWRTPPGFLAVRSTATTRTRSRSAWRCDRAFGQIEVPDENARVPALDILLRAGMGFLRQCCEPGSVQRVLEILYLKCERSDENEPLLRRRELLEKQGQRFGLRQIRRAVERGELPARLDVELASIYLQSLWDGICGTLAWTERLRDDPWNRAERMFRAGLDSLRSSPYLLLADA